MPVAASNWDVILDQVRRRRPGFGPDGWSPTVQGAVATVLGTRDDSGRPSVLKIFRPDALDSLRSEVSAQRLLAAVAGLPVPRTLDWAELAAPGIGGYVVMTRLAGHRWADRRPGLDPATAVRLAGEAGALLRRLHQVPGPRFGPLDDRAPSWPDARAAGADRAATALAAYRAAGGPAAVADPVQAYLERRLDSLATCSQPVLCHNDFIDGNLLISGGRRPTFTGIVDLERASFGDPMSDVAQTAVHVGHHRPADVAALHAGYRITPDEESRLPFYEVLHAVRERSWITGDRPAGWRRSVATLDCLLLDRVARSET